MSFIKTTEQDSKYNHLEKMSISGTLTTINKEDQTVAFAVEKAIPQIEELTQKIVEQMIKDIFVVECIPNHSGCLLTSKADLIVKNKSHQIGSDRKNFKVLEATDCLSIFLIWLEIYHHLEVTYLQPVMF